MGRTSGHIFIVSAPSGAGKTTLCRALLKRFPDIDYSISFTTRPPRPGERDGVDYHFISEAEFTRGIENHRWAEWARVHGSCYGTDAGVLRRAERQGRDILLDIDVQGTRQLLTRFPEAVTVFVMPPSLDALRRRLETRGSDTPQVIDRRLATAEEEIRSRGLYRHHIVNDDLSAAIEALVSIVAGYRRQDSKGSSADPKAGDR